MSDTQNSRLIITDRCELYMNGVERVLGFEDDYVLLECKEGRITIEGSGLAIESLTKECGEIEIRGKIYAVIYSNTKTERKSFFARTIK